MHRRFSQDIAERWPDNPIITLRDLSFPCGDICNAGAVKMDGEYVLLVTIEGLEGRYSIYPARSADGYKFDVADQPLLEPSSDVPYALYEEMGVKDARISEVEGTYYISYDAFGAPGYVLALARTDDFRSAQRVGLISEPDTKGGVLFPRKIKGRYARLERPWSGRSIWVAYSDDLEYWGGAEVVISPRGGFWDNSHVGVATPPLEINEGWLFIYYGVRHTAAGPLFRLGATVLDGEHLTRVIGRTNVPILSPREEYERIGDVPNLVFSCGAILEPDGVVKIYYGASNSCICVATTGLQEIVDTCMQSYKEF